MRKLAKADGGGPQGAWGKLNVSGKLVTLECEDEPPTTLATLLKKHFSTNGHAIQVEAHVAEADDGSLAAPIDQTDAKPTNIPEPVAGLEDEDTVNEGDAEGTSGNLSEIIAKARKKPQFFAWVYGKDGLILKAHQLKGADVMLRLAKAEGGQAKGAWGHLSIEGKSLFLKTIDDPPAGFIKRAKQALRDQGQNFRVVLRAPSGEVVEELDPDPEAPVVNADALDELKAAQERYAGPIAELRSSENKGLSEKLDVLLVMLGTAIEDGDVAHGMKVSSLIAATLSNAGITVPDQPTPSESQVDIDELGETALDVLADETDRIFFIEHPEYGPNKKIASKDDPAAADWLAIRKRLAAAMSGAEDPQPGPDAPGGSMAFPTPEEIEVFRHNQRDEKLRHDLSGIFNLSKEEVLRLENWALDNSMTEEEHVMWTDETGGDKLAEALMGKSDLGELSDDQQTALLFQVAQKWVFSPERDESGALENISEFTAFAKKHPELRSKVAAVFVQLDSINTSFTGSDYDTLEQERNLSISLRDHAIDLDPNVAALHIAGKGGPVHLAEILLGHVPRKLIPGASYTNNPDLNDENFAPPSEDRRNAILLAVANGALPDEAAQMFMERMFASTSRYDISPFDTMLGTVLDYDVTTEKEQNAMAALLAGRANGQNGTIDGSAEKTKSHFKKIMASPGGREVLFSTSIDTEFRKWALERMTPDPYDPDDPAWTAEQMSEGWESNVVCKAFGATALEQAKQQAEERQLSIDPSKAPGSATNLIGQLLGKKPDNLPDEDETTAERKAREAAGFEHSMYDDDEEPISSYIEHVIGEKGKPLPPAEIIVIPVTLINRQEGPASFKVLRIERENEAPFFMDDKGGRYNTWTNWRDKNELPPGKITFPNELDLSKPLITAETPAGSSGNRILSGVDKVAMAAGAVAGVVVVVGSGGTRRRLLVQLPPLGAAGARSRRFGKWMTATTTSPILVIHRYAAYI